MTLCIRFSILTRKAGYGSRVSCNIVFSDHQLRQMIQKMQRFADGSIPILGQNWYNLALVCPVFIYLPRQGVSDRLGVHQPIRISGRVVYTVYIGWCTPSRSETPCLGRYINTGQTSAALYQFCLRMGMEPVPETSYLLNRLTRLMAREDYIESCCR
jgi:hypothetical protein